MKYLLIFIILQAVGASPQQSFQAIVAEADKALKTRPDLINSINKIKQTREDITIIISMDERRIQTLGRYTALVAGRLRLPTEFPPNEIPDISVGKKLVKQALDDLTEYMYMGHDDDSSYEFFKSRMFDVVEKQLSLRDIFDIICETRTELEEEIKEWVFALGRLSDNESSSERQLATVTPKQLIATLTNALIQLRSIYNQELKKGVKKELLSHMLDEIFRLHGELVVLSATAS